MAVRGGARGEWTFCAAMSLVVAMVVGVGFGPGYARGLASADLPWWLHLHGAVMAGWIALFVVQTALVRRRKIALHRTLGWLSIGLVAVMLPLGLATDILAIRRGSTPPFFTPAEMLAADSIDLLLFTGLVGAALLLRRHRDWHKRLLLCATILLTFPAFGRLDLVRGFGIPMILPISAALLILLALIGPVYDWVTRHRVHPAYLWGVGLIVLAQPLHIVLAESPPIRAIVKAVSLPAG